MPLVTVDIGNTRLKLGLFRAAEAARGARLPEPDSVLSVTVDRLDEIRAWLAPRRPADVVWHIGSVQRSFTTELVDWLRREEQARVGLQGRESIAAAADAAAAPRITLLCASDLPLRVELPRPDMVGIDRLLAAVGVNALREPSRPAVIVDLGTAVTVDLVSADGAFQGGAILPGIAMSARALHEFTDLLPRIEMADLHEAPAEVGKDTVAAMRAGLFWGTIGAARELIARMTATDVVPIQAAARGRRAHRAGSSKKAAAPASKVGSQPQVFLTGGAAASVAQLLAPGAQHVPHLTLGGMMLTVAHLGGG